MAFWPVPELFCAVFLLKGNSERKVEVAVVLFCLIHALQTWEQGYEGVDVPGASALQPTHHMGMEGPAP